MFISIIHDIINNSLLDYVHVILLYSIPLLCHYTHYHVHHVLFVVQYVISEQVPAACHAI